MENVMNKTGDSEEDDDDDEEEEGKITMWKSLIERGHRDCVTSMLKKSKR